jgi:hypothetical protein
MRLRRAGGMLYRHGRGGIKRTERWGRPKTGKRALWSGPDCANLGANGLTADVAYHRPLDTDEERHA